MKHKMLFLLILVVCFVGMFGCSYDGNIYYNAMDGVACGTPPPPSEDEPVPQTVDLTEAQYIEMAGVDLRDCLPKSCEKFFVVSQYAVSDDNFDPLKICSTYAKDPADNSDRNIYLEIIFEESANSFSISYEEDTVRTSLIEGHEVLLFEQPAVKHGNGHKTASTYIASFEIDDVGYYLEVRNGNKKDTLEQICTEMLRQLSN